jgi:outer membrane protein assembly factor BamA
VDETDRQLPISERFFGGGSNSLRGFGFEEAGPRLIAPTCYTQTNITPDALTRCTTFRNRQGQTVRLNPFTVPVGGNGLAVLNLEARIPFTKQFQIVPFYDAGNVFRSARDIFGGSATTAPNLRQRWTNTVGLGIRVKTPFGGSFAVDYGFMLNPPRFFIPQFPQGLPDAIYRLPPSQIHFRFAQAF